MRTVGVLLFPEFEFLDATGPIEVLGRLSDQVQLLTFAARRGPVASTQGPAIVAEHDFAGCPPLDILVVPGGVGTRTEVDNEELLAVLSRLANEAEIVFSICTGAALLARAGVLDGRRATSNKRAFEWVQAQSRSVDWIRQARWVEDGKFLTSSGVAAGIDSSFALVHRLAGDQRATSLAAAIEYEWHRDADDDQFARRDS